jgi:histidyl-tRNA synthetase
MEAQGAYMGRVPAPHVYVVTSGEGAENEAVLLAHDLRARGVSADLDFMGRSMKAQMKTSSQAGAKFVCILGEDEISSGAVAVKDMSGGTQETAPRAAAIEKIVSWKEECR